MWCDRIAGDGAVGVVENERFKNALGLVTLRGGRLKTENVT